MSFLGGPGDGGALDLAEPPMTWEIPQPPAPTLVARDPLLPSLTVAVYARDGESYVFKGYAQR